MKAKKSLGQHFLRSPAARAAIVRAGGLKATDIVLEIGPGRGFLTEALLASGARKIIAVEKDDQLVEFLRAKFAAEISTGRLELTHADILDWLKDEDFSKLHAPSYKLIANLPYYLTGQILRLCFGLNQPPELAVLMLQKEVAERIAAKDGKESLLSISVKVFGQPRYLKTVPAGAFWPKPKVDSAILMIENMSRAALAKVGEKKFFDLLHRGFAHKRKLVRSNLKNYLRDSTAAFQTCNIESKARAENLTLEQWLCLAKSQSSF